MFGALGSLGLGLYDGVGGFGIPLIGGASLRPGHSFARASSGALIDRGTGALVEVASGAPRFDSVLGLLIEGQRTNLLTQVLDLTTGFYFVAATTAALIAGVGGKASAGCRITENTATAQHALQTNTTNNYAVTTGLPYAFSVYAKAGSLDLLQLTAGAGFASFHANFDLTNGVVTATNLCTAAIQNAGGGWWRCIVMVTANASVANGSMRFNLINSGTDGRAPSYLGSSRFVDVSIPQVEQAAFASSPIFHPVGSPAVTTRLPDTLSWLLSTLNVPDSGLCTLVGRFMLPQAAPSTGALFLWQVDEGGDNNRYLDRNNSGTSIVTAGRATAGVGADLPAFTTMTPGVSFMRAATISSGRIALAVDGGGTAAVTGGPTSGLTRLRIGDTATGLRELYGYVQAFSILPGIALPDAVLPNLRI